MRTYILVLLSIVILNGCKHQGAVSPQQQVIAVPKTPAFDIAGTWVAVSDPSFPDETKPITVRKIGEGVYSIEILAPEEFEIELRTTELGDAKNYAITEVLASAGGSEWGRYLGLIAMKNGAITVWWIESKNLARLLHADGHSAVIEHSAFGSKIHAGSDDLLDCIQKHSRELVGQPTLFTKQSTK